MAESHFLGIAGHSQKNPGFLYAHSGSNCCSDPVFAGYSDLPHSPPRAHALEEEALLQAIEDAAICPGCNRRIEAAWIACPNCHTLLKKQCQSCGKVIALPWNLCPYCATPVEGARKETSAASTETQLPLDDEFLSHP
jgi:predicted amidophosphoribosyltransferase